MADASQLARKHFGALGRLSGRAELARFYLAGGSAIALQLNHRVSLDLDFFSMDADADLHHVERAIEESFSQFHIVTRSEVAVQFLADGSRLDFVLYPYALLEPAIHLHGVAVASLLDLGVMKLAAIAKRGLRRDFWDLFEIVHRGRQSLETLGDAYLRRFGLRESDLYHVLKALTYFDDAERDPALPAGMTPEQWEEIKTFLRREAPRLVMAGT